MSTCPATKTYVVAVMGRSSSFVHVYLRRSNADAMEMGELKTVYDERESERASEGVGHVSVLSCALLSPLRPDTPRMHAIIIELSAIIRCHFCPSEVFLPGTPVSFSTHSCQSLTSNNTESSMADGPWPQTRMAPIHGKASVPMGCDERRHTWISLLTGCQYRRYGNTDKGKSGNVA